MRARNLAAATLVAALATAGLALPLASPAAAAGALRDDFDGDGHRDLAIGSPTSNSVTVTFGSASGLSPDHAVTLTQDSPGIPGVREDEDEFGENITSADVDGDGFADLIIGAPGEQVGDRTAGLVTIVRGSADGFAGATTLDAPDGSDARFGEGASFIDLDGDGTGNLAVISEGRFWWYGDGVPDGPAIPAEGDGFPAGVKLEGITGADFTGGGNGGQYAVYGSHDDGSGYLGLLPGGPGDVGTGLRTLAQGDDPRTTNGAAATGDIDDDGHPDLVSGNEDDNSVTVWFGGPDGLTGDGRTATYTQDSQGIPGVTEDGDRFGASVDTGDVDGDGDADVAVGVPGEKVGSTPGVGSVVLIEGGPEGLGAGRTWHQDVTGMPGTPENDDHFGSTVQLKDITKDGHADLAATANGEDIQTTADVGAVWSLRGSASGLTTKSVTSFHGADFGLGHANAGFGEILQ